MSVPRSIRISAHRLHKATGQARVIINGRHRCLGPHGSPESNARYEESVRHPISDRAVAEMQDPIQVSSDLIVSELVAADLQHARTYDVKRGRPTPRVSQR